MAGWQPAFFFPHFLIMIVDVVFQSMVFKMVVDVGWLTNFWRLLISVASLLGSRPYLHHITFCDVRRTQQYMSPASPWKQRSLGILSPRSFFVFCNIYSI